MLSTRVITLLGQTAAHAWTTVRRNPGRVEGVIHVSDPDTHLVPNMLNGVYVWTPTWPVHNVQTRPSSREAYNRGEAWCSVGGVYPTSPVQFSHHGDSGHDVCVIFHFNCVQRIHKYILNVLMEKYISLYSATTYTNTSCL